MIAQWRYFEKTGKSDSLVRMRIIESIVVGKTGRDEVCEDGIVITDHHAAIIDGATSEGPSSFCRQAKPGLVAMELVRSAIERLALDADIESAVRLINETIMDFYRECSVVDEVTADARLRCNASAVIYSAARRELWMIGDSQALVDGKRICFDDPSDWVFQNLRSFLISAKIESKETTYEKLMEHDIVRDLIYPLMNYQTFLHNSSYRGDFQYAHFNGFDIDREFMHKVSLGPDVNEVVLASDGYPYLKNTLKKSERALKELLEKDPLLYKYFKSTKGLVKGNISFDDRSFIRLNP